MKHDDNYFGRDCCMFFVVDIIIHRQLSWIYIYTHYITVTECILDIVCGPGHMKYKIPKEGAKRELKPVETIYSRTVWVWTCLDTSCAQQMP